MIETRMNATETEYFFNSIFCTFSRDTTPFLMDEEVPTLLSSELDDSAPRLIAESEKSQNAPRVPVTLITGFLGSGKVCIPVRSTNFDAQI